jgi:hypothetical protein
MVFASGQQNDGTSEAAAAKAISENASMAPIAT